MTGSKKIGRPISENPKNRRITIKLTQEEFDSIEDFAKKINLKKSQVLLKGFELLKSTDK